MLFGQEHVDTYRQTAGQEGYDWQGTTVLILTTKGRRSGGPRDAPLIFAERDGDYVIVASRGGTPTHPSWYLNLEHDPNVEVQIKGERFPVRARTAAGEERDELWRLMTQSWPAYDDYQRKTDREIPVVVLERA
jgi:deazaflavin-dependent oxidoreductase (nitroreductase family)